MVGQVGVGVWWMVGGLGRWTEARKTEHGVTATQNLCAVANSETHFGLWNDYGNVYLFVCLFKIVRSRQPNCVRELFSLPISLNLQFSSRL